MKNRKKLNRLALIGILATGSIIQPMGTGFGDRLLPYLSTAVSSLQEQASEHPKTALALTATTLALTYFSRPNNVPAQRWNWEKLERDGALNPENLSFPTRNGKPFIWAAGSNALQNEGGHTAEISPWCAGIQQQIDAGKTDMVLPGIACDHQKRYKEDIQLAKDLGLNGDRFSLSWSKLQPSGSDELDQGQLNFYKAKLTEHNRQGIRPVIGLYHYDESKKFIERGGFANPENIEYFADYCARAYDALKEYDVEAWFTFNSPIAGAISSYQEGRRPPFKTMKGKQKGLIFASAFYSINTEVEQAKKNSLEAHKLAYQKMNAIYEANKHNPRVKKPRIGITKNMYNVQAWGSTRLGNLGLGHWTNPLNRLYAHVANSVQDNIFDAFFSTEENRATLDCIGLNTYSTGFAKGLSPSPKPYPSTEDMQTSNPRNTLDMAAEVVYNGIVKLAKLVPGKPIYVTENGVATGDTDNDQQKQELFTKRVSYALHKAIQDGYNVVAYCRWALLSNYEWGMYGKNYGFYNVDRTTLDPSTDQPTLERTLRPGSRYFAATVKIYRQKYDAQRSQDQEPYWLTATGQKTEHKSATPQGLRQRPASAQA